MWGAEICLQGTATYDVDILKVCMVVLQWTPSNPATLGTSQSALISTVDSL